MDHTSELEQPWQMLPSSTVCSICPLPYYYDEIEFKTYGMGQILQPCSRSTDRSTAMTDSHIRTNVHLENHPMEDFFVGPISPQRKW